MATETPNVGHAWTRPAGESWLSSPCAVCGNGVESHPGWDRERHLESMRRDYALRHPNGPGEAPDAWAGGFAANH